MRPPTILRTIARAATGIALLGAITAGTVLAATFLLPRALGARTVVIAGGSMTPTVNAGDAVVVRDADTDGIQPGDVITFRPLRSERTTTHRVEKVVVVDGMVHFQTKGDANGSPDPDLAPASHVTGTVRLRLPRIGYLAAFASTTTGKLVFIVLPIMILFARELASLVRPARLREARA